MRAGFAHPVRFQREGNALHPLPPDYDDLDRNGQRAARVNACSLQANPTEFVESWSFFRKYYLGATVGDDRLEKLGFRFYDELMPTSGMHHAWIDSLARHKFNVLGAPRGSAKSVIIGTEVPMQMVLTNANYKLLLILSTDRFVEQRMEVIGHQLTENPLIVEDFGKVKGAIWNKHHLILQNRSSILGLSVEGKMRGQRPDGIILDDVEQDIDTIADPATLLDRLENLLFTVLRPMLDRKFAWLTWIGTLDSLRSFLYHCITTKDPRFEWWNRMHYLAIDDDGTLAWEAKWNESKLEVLRLQMGDSEFMSQMQGRPISSGTRILRFREDRHTYWFDGPEPYRNPEPLDTETTLIHPISIKDIEGMRHLEDTRVEWKPFIRDMRRFITVDYAPTQKESSDYSVVHVMGQSSPDILWSLDMFCGKVTDNVLIEIIWKLLEKWCVQIVGIEAIGMQEAICHQMQTNLQERVTKLGWKPRIIPIKYKSERQVSKASRIMCLEPRFNNDAIRLPRTRLGLPFDSREPYRMLKAQILDFTPDMKALQKDDCLDTLAMNTQIIRSRLKDQLPVPMAQDDLLEKIRKGETHDPETGLSYFDGMPLDQIPMEVFDSLRRKHYDLLKAKASSNYPRSRRARRIAAKE